MSKIKHSSKSHRCLFAFYRRIFLKLLLGLKERLNIFRSSRPEVFLRKGVLKIYSNFTGEHPCRSAISIKLLCNFIEIALRYGCSPVKMLYIFRTPFPKNTSEPLLLMVSTNFWLSQCILSNKEKPSSSSRLVFDQLWSDGKVKRACIEDPVFQIMKNISENSPWLRL